MTQKSLEQPKSIEGLVEGLRKMADFIEAHPEIVSNYTSVSIYEYTYNKDAFKDKVKLLRKAGKLKKEFNDFSASARRHFSPNVWLTHSINREQVCERIVTGTKEIPATMIPAHTEEIIEWKCADKTFTK